MIYYELLEDGTIDRSTNNIKIAQLNGYYNENHIVEKEEDIVYGYDNKRYLKGKEPVKPQILIEKENAVARLEELTTWFDNYFDKQLTQSQWQDDFAVSYDDYFNKNYANIDELKAQAKIVRNEIRKLRAL